jgi:hypothetical protein
MEPRAHHAAGNLSKVNTPPGTLFYCITSSKQKKKEKKKKEGIEELVSTNGKGMVIEEKFCKQN